MATSSTISTEAEVMTLINVFTVAPDKQAELVDLLTGATEQVMRHLPGFVSANIHASTDGACVVNYAQWESQEAFTAMLANPSAREHMDAIRHLATSEPRIHTVASVHHA